MVPITATTDDLELDALIVGSGFGGVYQLKRLRDRGFNVKLVEAGSDFGGVWYWNRYPGCRVDIPVPLYEFSDPELWTDWTWQQKFPGSTELRSYFEYVAKKWDLRKDTIFNSMVSSATWHETSARWHIRTSNGDVFKTQFFLPNTGFAAKRHIPDWKGIDTFKATFIHPSYWSKEEPDLKGKKIAVIGTGSTGIQLAQALAPLASEFYLFQRTPNMCNPMGQEDCTGGKDPTNDRYALYAGRKDSYGGVDFNFLPKATFEDNEEERKQTYESLWAEGDFHYWLAGYHDTLFSDLANTEAYNFWKAKEKFAPEIKPHAFGCKRVSLENGFYELFDKPNVHLIDVKDDPIEEITSTGIKTAKESFDLDFVVCATGYDAITGGIIDMNISGEKGVKLNEKWRDGVKTYLGLSVSSFPNMFFTYGPQAATALCNGPSCAEIQGDWIVSTLECLRQKNLNKINAEPGSEKAWAETTQAIADASLLPTARSWYMGDNIPGKPRECLLYLGGVPTYYKTIHECASNGYQGFELR